ncbi:hypothetical protein HAP32_05158 (plasmid) [Serratia fonticola]|nr:hypothetical protein HAP32_05158 [Serratia fonticola]
MKKILIAYFIFLLSSCAILVDSKMDIDNTNLMIKDEYTLR